MRKVTPKRTFNPDKSNLYPGRERLYRQMGEQRYLTEIRNPFNQIMANEFPEHLWKGIDTLLLTQAPKERLDRIFGEEEESLPSV
jgi:hypothetical protein